MMSEQLFSIRDRLGEQAKPHKWGAQIGGTLDCIALMARCNLLMSKESLGTIELSGKGLQYVGLYLYHPPLTDDSQRYNSLRANIRNCNQMGLDALRSTAEHMGEVDRLARNMPNADGIVSKWVVLSMFYI